jgi:hypothetical protein
MDNNEMSFTRSNRWRGSEGRVFKSRQPTSGFSVELDGRCRHQDWPTNTNITAPPGQGANTRRTQDSRVCTAVRDSAAVGTIVWNPWKPPDQM